MGPALLFLREVRAQNCQRLFTKKQRYAIIHKMYFGETGEIPVRARRREMRRLRHTEKQTIGSLTLLPQGRGQGHWETEKADC